MRERSQADNIVPEAQVVTEPKDVVRWLLIPRWCKVLCVGSALFGAMYGSTADLVLATASAVAGILVLSRVPHPTHPSENIDDYVYPRSGSTAQR